MAGWDAKAKLGPEFNAAFDYLNKHGSAPFQPFDVAKPPRGQLASELSKFHREGLLVKTAPTLAGASNAVIIASRAHASTVKDSWDACEAIEVQLKGIVTELDSLLGKHKFVTEKTKTLREACEHLKAEKAALEKYYEQLQSHTQHFQQLEAATAMANKPQHAQSNSSGVPTQV